MKKVYYLYSDLETTQIKNDTQNYKNYFKQESYEIPKIYSWGIIYSGEYKKLVEDSENWKYKFNEKWNYHFHFGISGKSYIEFLKNINVDCKIYFNNSKGFDAHYIQAELINDSYTPVLPFEKEIFEKQFKLENINDYTSWYEKRYIFLFKWLKKSSTFKDLDKSDMYKKIKRYWNYRYEKEYSLMTNENTQILKLSFSSDKTYWSQGVKFYRQINIIDNLSIFGTSIKKMGETIAKYFIKSEGWSKEKAEKQFHKQEIDYERYNLYKSFEEFENDGNELDYLEQDIFILFQYHILIEKYLPRDKWKLTAASTAYANWLEYFTKTNIEKYEKQKIIKKVTVKNGGWKYQYGKKLYSDTQVIKVILDKILPTKWLDTVDKEFYNIHSNLYRWYSGGLVGVNEKYRGMLIKNVSVVDINSSYPTQMYKDIDIPVGVGFKGYKKGYNFHLYKLIVKKTIINQKGIPFIYNIYDEKRCYRKILKRDMVFYLNTYELERFKKYYTNDNSKYDLSIEWSFKTISMTKLFRPFIDKWYKIKQDADIDGNGVLKAIAKLFLNSLYGKFGTKSERTSRLWNPFTNEWVKYSERIKSKFYLPLAISITSLARMQLVDMVHEGYKNVIYNDTDSLFIENFKSENFNIELDDIKLGASKVEFSNATGIVRRPKQYFFIDDKGKRKVAFAGINFNAQLDNPLNTDIVKKSIPILKTLTFYDFVNGREIEKQISPYRVVGIGVLLESEVKNIKKIWDYKPLPEQIYKDEKDFEITLKNIDNYYNNHI